MLKKIFSFLAVLILIAETAPAAPHVDLGMNLDSSEYYTGEFIFKNIMYKMNTWTPYDTANQNRTFSYTFDSDGYPVPSVDYGGFWTWVAFHGGGSYLGDYVLLWDGDGELGVDDNGNKLPKTVIGDHRLTFSVSTWPGLLTVRIRRSNPNDHVRNIRLMQAEYESNYLTDPYNPDYLKILSNFKTIRFMWPNGVSTWDTQINATSKAVNATTITLADSSSSQDGFYNGWFIIVNTSSGGKSCRITSYDGATKTATISPALANATGTPSYWMGKSTPSKWEERTLPTNIKQNGGRGIAYEHIIGICNRLKVNPWICIPNTADDDFVAKTADLFRDNLDPSLKLYVEWSNETWNFGFPGFRVAYTLALNTPGLKGNPAWAYHAYRATQIFRIFNVEYGEPDLTVQRNSSRIVRVLASQYVYTDPQGPTDTIVNFSGWPPGDPRIGHKAYEYADALAVAPYWGSITADQARTLTTDQLLDSVSSQLDSTMAMVSKNLRWSQPAHLDLIAYEGGQNFALSTMNNQSWFSLSSILKPFFYSDRWRSLIRRALETWSSFGKNDSGYGVGLFCEFSLMGGPSQYGYWGHWDQQVNPNDPNPKKYGLFDYLSNRQVPVPPTQLFANIVNGHEVKLVWEDNSDNETNFEVERKEINDADFGLLSRLPNNVSNFDDTTPTLGKSYQYRLRAINASGGSEYSNIVNVVMPNVDAIIPQAPVEVRASADSSWTIRVTWRTDDPNVWQFVVQRQNLTTGLFENIAQLPLDARLYIDDGLADQKTYTYRVVAKRGAWESAPSWPSSATTFPLWAMPYDAPSSFSANVQLPSNVSLTWKDNASNEQSYQVLRQDPGLAFQVISTLPGNSIAYTDLNLKPGIYYYQLAMTRSDASVAKTTAVQVYIPSPNAPPDGSPPPPPSSVPAGSGSLPECRPERNAWVVGKTDSDIHFLDCKSEEKIRIFDRFGREVWHGFSTDAWNGMDLSGKKLPSGTYGIKTDSHKIQSFTIVR